MTAKNGKPCPKCGGNEWNAKGKCAPCARERSRQWAKNNPERVAANYNRWVKANPEKSAAHKRKWKKNHPENSAANARQWYKKNPEKAAARNSQWHKDNPERAIAKVNRRRTLKTNAGGSFTAAEWKSLVEHYGSRCLCCGRTDVKLAADHVIPVSKGGTSNIDNIQPLCKSCNSSKRDKIIDYRPTSGIGRWIQRKLFG